MLISSKATSPSVKPLPTRADLAWERGILLYAQYILTYHKTYAKILSSK